MTVIPPMQSPARSPAQTKNRHVLWIAAVLIVLLAIGLRAMLLNNAPTFDEIWSMTLAAQMQSPLDVFSLHIDNNHYFNTLWLYILGPSQPYWLYHLPSFFAGILLVITVIAHGWKKDPVQRLVMGLMVATSAMLLFYGSQARGYVPMLLFGYLSFVTMQRLFEKQQLRDALLFALLGIIAFLWQLLYIHLYAALAIWSLLWLRKNRGDRRSILLVSAHFPIALFLFLLTITDLSHFKLGGGPPSTPTEMFLGLVQLLIPITDNGNINTLVGILLLVPLTVCVEHSWNRHRLKAWFLLTLLFIAPVAWMISFHPLFLYPRFFLVQLFFVLLILGASLAALCRQKNQWIRSAGLVLVGAYVGVQVHVLPSLFYDGTDFLTPLRTVAQILHKPTITIGSDDNKRLERVLWFYLPKLRREGISMRYTGSQTIENDDLFLTDRIFFPTPAVVRRAGTIFTKIDDPAASSAEWMFYEKSSPEQ